MVLTALQAPPSLYLTLSPCQSPPLHLPRTICKNSTPNSQPAVSLLKYTSRRIATTVFDPLCQPHKISQNNTSVHSWRTHATAEDNVPAASDSPLIIPAEDTAASTIISTLLFIAFVALSILTIGVIYIGVTEFLAKREREKFEKEEAEKKKKGGKKNKVRAKTGPRGFGQKVEDDDDY